MLLGEVGDYSPIEFMGRLANLISVNGMSIINIK